MPLNKVQQLHINGSIDHLIEDLTPTQHSQIFNAAFAGTLERYDSPSEIDTFFRCIAKPTVEIKNLERHNRDITVSDVQEYIFLYSVCRLVAKCTQPAIADFDLETWLKKFTIPLSLNNPMFLELCLKETKAHLKLLEQGWNINRTLKFYQSFKKANQVSFVTSLPVDHSAEDFSLEIPLNLDKIYKVNITTHEDPLLPSSVIDIYYSFLIIIKLPTPTPMEIHFPNITRVSNGNLDEERIARIKDQAITLAETTARDEAIRFLQRETHEMEISYRIPDGVPYEEMSDNDNLEAFESGSPLQTTRLRLEAASQNRPPTPYSQSSEPEIVAPTSKLVGTQLLTYQCYFDLVHEKKARLEDFRALPEKDIAKFTSFAVIALMKTKRYTLGTMQLLTENHIKVIENPYYLTQLLNQYLSLNQILILTSEQCRILALPPIINLLQQQKSDFANVIKISYSTARIMTEEYYFNFASKDADVLSRIDSFSDAHKNLLSTSWAKRIIPHTIHEIHALSFISQNALNIATENHERFDYYSQHKTYHGNCAINLNIWGHYFGVRLCELYLTPENRMVKFDDIQLVKKDLAKLSERENISEKDIAVEALKLLLTFIRTDISKAYPNQNYSPLYTQIYNEIKNADTRESLNDTWRLAFIRIVAIAQTNFNKPYEIRFFMSEEKARLDAMKTFCHRISELRPFDDMLPRPDLASLRYEFAIRR